LPWNGKGFAPPVDLEGDIPVQILNADGGIEVAAIGVDEIHSDDQRPAAQRRQRTVAAKVIPIPCVRGIGFNTADAIAMSISYPLTEAMDDGHCGLPQDELLPATEKLLEAPVELTHTVRLLPITSRQGRAFS
jgi:hypothetical protein